MSKPSLAIFRDASAVLVGGLNSFRVSEEERELFRSLAPAGVTLFSRNISDFSQLGQLTSELQALRDDASLPLIIAMDQEGGRVARLKAPFPNQGPALLLAKERADEGALAELSAYGGEVGQALRQLGITLNFAPVLDVLGEHTHHSIGDRAFSRDPQQVALRAGAFLAGMQKTGLFGCLKHFPGQGGGRSDTHVTSAVVDKSLAELQQRDLLPFRELISAASLVMLSHCIYPSLDHREASLSPIIIEGLLRKDLGFKGVAVSDDMTMAAVNAQVTEFGTRIVEAVESGIDLLLICKDIRLWREAHAALCYAAEESRAFKQRLRQAADRVRGLRKKMTTNVTNFLPQF